MQILVPINTGNNNKKQNLCLIKQHFFFHKKFYFIYTAMWKPKILKGNCTDFALLP